MEKHTFYTLERKLDISFGITEVIQVSLKIEYRLTFRKHAYSYILKILPQKMKIFR